MTGLVWGSTGRGDFTAAPDTSCSLSKKSVTVTNGKLHVAYDPRTIFCSATYVEPGVFATANHCLDEFKGGNIVANCGCSIFGCKYNLDLNKAVGSGSLKNLKGDSGLLFPTEKPKNFTPAKAANIKDYLSPDGKKTRDDSECFATGYGVSRESIATAGGWYRLWDRSRAFEIRPFWKKMKTDKGEKNVLVSEGPKVYGENIEWERKSYLDRVDTLPFHNKQELHYLLSKAQGLDGSEKKDFSYFTYHAPLVHDLLMPEATFQKTSIKPVTTRGDSGGSVFCRRFSEKEWKFVGVVSQVMIHAKENSNDQYYYSTFESVPITQIPIIQEQAFSPAIKVRNQSLKKKSVLIK